MRILIPTIINNQLTTIIKYLFLSWAILVNQCAWAQDDGESKFEFKGYLKYLTTVNFQEVNEDWITDNLFHNRLEFRYYPQEKWKFDLEMRNRLFYGEFVKLSNKNPGMNYADFIDRDNGFFDLSFNWAEGSSYVMNTTIDRFYVDYISGKWQVRAGRHRINWGQNLVWNPNDVFNAYSYFDFDYEERPGTDAVRVQYFSGATSAAEFVYQLGDNIDDMSFMGLYKFSKWNYDIQFLGGQVKRDLVIGTGWSGDIKGGGFRGEFTYFHDKDSLSEPVGQLVASISGDYTLRNSVYLHASIIYNSNGSTGKAGMINPNILTQTSAKFLTLSRLDIFGQVSYPISPLWRADLASIVNPFDGSFFIGPGAGYSISDNMELLLFGQLFVGDEGTEFGGVGKLFYFRYKWAF
jgi:hypothetical protein